ncbi:hypothetical protein A1O1_04994 [Capronia coronata CBS 617.96]|uniref:Zn(2)-C6 fungal-type domain-containing protein n=1 Tax=Capronia coronata CBS 617.96 TaxID=1182541 RepID=W9YFN4_9EURO|nr:uncharacterized protein A1O1_04994 [Capronia coronata CBS 617.96]EXJ88066.1 hypothetical protein A1O1_04994 [Capronia coronata CBS 617.96]
MSAGFQGSAWDATDMSTPRPRQKRAQVVRACDACRRHRIKCDNQIPCLNCKSRGGECSNAAVTPIILPSAYREIERLRQKVQELERELQHERSKAAVGLEGQTHGLATPHSSKTTSSQSHSQSQSQSQVIDSAYGSPRGSWDGINIRTARSTGETWYGPSSLFYFIGRISSYLSSTYQQTHSSDQMLDLNPPSTLLDGPITADSSNTVDRRLPSQAGDRAQEANFLSPMQEEYFLDLYWQSYHTALAPVLNEAEFKEHYRSLWVTGGDSRSASALVDIVVALGMQYGGSMLPTTRQQYVVGNDKDATVAGRWYYLRCQRLLEYDLESPSISTLQCQILCAVYLCCGTFQNMADNFAGGAVRTAYMLGLHLEPPATMSPQERETRKRLWWTVYLLESKLGMKLGRPFLLRESNATPALPDHGLDAAMHSGSNFAPLGGNLTWLSFNVEHTKLFMAARSAYTAFYDNDLHSANGQSMWTDLPSLEAHAELLSRHMKGLEEWANAVPSALTTARKNNGRPFSTDEPTLLDVDPFAPLWLQRQRLLLEMIYHNLCMNLYRPFIFFGTAPHSILAEQNAVKCALHAITLTKITHQALSTTTILHGWHEAFQWQWNAAMTLVGYVLAYPRGATLAAARDAINLCLEVFDIFGNSFTVAISAATIVRKLITKIDFLVQPTAGRQIPLENTEAERLASVTGFRESNPERSLTEGSFMASSTDSDVVLDDATTASLQDTFNMAFGVDQWADLNMLWPSLDDGFLNTQGLGGGM